MFRTSTSNIWPNFKQKHPIIIYYGGTFPFWMFCLFPVRTPAHGNFSYRYVQVESTRNMGRTGRKHYHAPEFVHSVVAQIFPKKRNKLLVKELLTDKTMRRTPDKSQESRMATSETDGRTNVIWWDIMSTYVEESQGEKNKETSPRNYLRARFESNLRELNEMISHIMNGLLKGLGWK
jgi:hypothetical protein